MTEERRPGRPTHLPACQPCRKRKSKCALSNNSDTCLSCQVHGTICTFPQAEKGIKTTSNKRKRITPRSNDAVTSEDILHDHNISHDNHTQQLNEGNTTSMDSFVDGFTEADENVAHVVGPITAFDNDILENYLSSISASAISTGRLTSSVALMNEQGSTPVVFDTIRKRPVGASGRQSLAASKCELIEQLIGPSAHEVLQLHFKFVNKNFPLFDHEHFLTSYGDLKSHMSPALLCNLYASACIYWKRSPQLMPQRAPDVRFVWNQAGEALYSEMFLSPGMSVIIAIILNLNGRPSTSMLGNGSLTGFATSLSNSLGLNRDPTRWQIPQSEKNLRIRIWWMVVIFDKWFSLAYGTPSRIQWSHFDVPYPTLEVLNLSSTSSSHDRVAGTIYIALLTLTKVLDHYLDFVYCLCPSPTRYTVDSAEELGLVLSRWEETLTGEVREIIVHKTNLTLPGAANFRLAYLGICLFLRKIQLDLYLKSQPAQTETSFGANSQRFMQSQRAAEDIVHFVKYLREDEITGFWSPMSAFALTSAVTFLLRNTVRLKHPDRDVPLNLAADMIRYLRKHLTEHDWDLADNCLKRWSPVVEKLSNVDQSNLNMPDPFQEDWAQDQWMLEELFPETWGALQE